MDIMEDEQEDVFTPGIDQPIDPIVGNVVTGLLAQRLGMGSMTGRKNILDAFGAYVVRTAQTVSRERVSLISEIMTGLSYLEMDAVTDVSSFNKGGANVVAPLTIEAYTTLHAWLLESVTNITPWYKAKSFPGADVSVSVTASRLQEWFQIYYETQSFNGLVDRLVEYLLKHGVSYARIDKQRIVKKVYDFAVLSRENVEEFGLRIAGGAVVGAPDGVPRQLGQIYNGYRTMVLNEYIGISPVSLLDTFVSPAEALADASRAMFIANVDSVSVAELLDRARAGILDEDAVHALTSADSSATAVYKNGVNRSHIKTDDEESLTSYEEDPLPLTGSAKKLEMLSGWILIDLDGDGVDEPWNFVVETSTRKVARLTRAIWHPYLPNYVSFSVYDKMDGVMPLPKLLDELQREATFAVNMRIDGGALANTFVIVEDKTATSNLTKIDLRPGLNLVEAEGGNAKEAFQVHNLGAEGQAGGFSPQYEEVSDLARRVTGTSEAMSGMVSNASPTATESSQALTNGARRLKVSHGRLVKSFLEFHHRVVRANTMLAMIKTGGNVEAVVPYPARDDVSRQPSQMSLGDFLTPVIWRMHGNGVNTDPMVQAQTSEKKYLMMERDGNVTTLAQRWYAAHMYLTSLGEEDPEVYIGTLAEAEARDKAAAESQDPFDKVKMPAVEKPTKEWLALFIAQNPDIAEQVIQSLAQVTEATETGEAEGDGSAEELEKERINFHKKSALQEIDHAEKMAEASLTSAEALADADRRTKEVATIAAVSEAASQAKDKASEVKDKKGEK